MDTAKLSELARDASADTRQRLLAAAREELRLDVSFVSRLSNGTATYTDVVGDGDSFSIAEGGTIAFDDTVCSRIAAGAAPDVIPDVRAEAAVVDAPVVEQGAIGSYVGVPIVLSDGTLHGMFCCLGRDARPSLDERDAAFMQVLARLMAGDIERARLVAEKQLFETATTAVDALVSALAARDGYTGEHALAVVELAREVAHEVGLSEEEVADVEQVALLHDVGKLGIPDAVLRKPGPLDESELPVIHEHPLIGGRIVSSIPALAHLAPAIGAEHERWDGGGYPLGLACDEIPLPSRIVFACDAYDAMTSDRPYRAALPVRVALDEIVRGAGTQFCPSTVAALEAVLEERGVRATATVPQPVPLYRR